MDSITEAGVTAGSLAWLGILLVLSIAPPAWAEIDSMSSAINKAGRQRMLTQRIVKAYCLVGLEVQTGRHKKQLADAIALFETQLAELKAFTSNQPAVGDGLAEVEALWKPFRETAARPVTREGADALLSTNEDLLAAAHAVVLLLEAESGTTVARLVNVAGRQRMLSQRLALLYMARAWAIEYPEIPGKMREAADEFETALLFDLVNAEANTPEIQGELKQAAKQWSLYKRGLRLEQDSGDYIPMVMAVTSENMLQTMNRITGMYEQLAER